MNNLRLIVYPTLALSLSGCVAAALAPVAMGTGQLVGGTSSNSINVTVDPSLTQEIAGKFAKAKTLAMPVSIETDARTGIALERIGQYKVTLDRDIGSQGNVLSDSEKQSELRSLCKKSKPDIALMISYNKTESPSVWSGVFTGRAVINFKWQTDFMTCRTGTQEQFSGLLSYDAGIFNGVGKSALSEQWANAMVGKLMEAFGRTTVSGKS